MQIDHRIPYEVVGDNVGDEHQLGHFMLLCGAAQRQKSWSCEHCENFLRIKDPLICKKCYWASPESYSHVAMDPEMRVDLVWKGKEVKVYEKIYSNAESLHMRIQDYIKMILKNDVSNL